MVNRDSMVLWVGALGALVLYLQNAEGPPLAWGYSEWLQFAAFVLAFISGKLATSPLPGQNDDQKISGLRSVVWPVLLVSALAASSCATSQALVTPAPTAEQVQAAKQQALVVATATKEASALALDAWRLADAAYEAGDLSDDAMQSVNDAALTVSRQGLLLLESLQNLAEAPSLKNTALEFLRACDQLLTALTPSTVTDTLRSALLVIRAYVGVM